MGYIAGEYDVIVIGAGHAGIEAALAASRMNKKTVMLTINLDTLGNMPCNPSIGGTSKGHLVREIDALGGQMGKTADMTMIQSKLLNISKGPAVHSLRAQIDRRQYHAKMKEILENEKNLDIRQGEVEEILMEEGKILGVVIQTGTIYKGKTIIVATGTYLKGKIIIGDVMYSSGPDGVFPANKLSESLEALGIPLRRFKTGTPARINKNTMDFSKMKIENGDDKIEPFSFENQGRIDLIGKQVPCYLNYTNEETHKVIRDNIYRSPLYSGKIKGIGPRYCPSIEDKIVRFADKERHQIFIEPMGENTGEMYIQGMSSSLPEDVQIQIYRSLPGMENVRFMRPAYAIEYDLIDSTNLKLSLEYKTIENLFFAGQINGSSGYEEAAAQGLIAGINAVLKLENKEPFILSRAEAYIGVLIDDLVTKGTNEPYRMMTSRAEYRLLLRQDNADMRLTKYGYDIGLISQERHEKFIDKMEKIKLEGERIGKLSIKPTIENNETLKSLGSSEITSGVKLGEIIKRTELTYENTKPFDIERVDLPSYVTTEVETIIKYSGYIGLQMQQVKQFEKLENKKLDENIDYSNITGLSMESRQKLQTQKPISIGQASRISGVSPADISVLLIYLNLEEKKGE